MNIEYFDNKKYEIPINCSSFIERKYRKVIEKDYSKYIDIIYTCGGLAMNYQVEKLVNIIDGSNRTKETNRWYCSRMLNELEKLGFLSSEHLNLNKFVFLRKKGVALIEGDHKTHKKIRIKRLLKNDNLRVSLLKIENLLENNDIFNYKLLHFHLKRITKRCLNLIINKNNKFEYDIEIIKKISESNNIQEGRSIAEENPEHLNKLGIIRDLWKEIGLLYNKMILQREVVEINPEYFKATINEQGEVFIQYVPNIIVFDVEKDEEFYKNKYANLFKTYFNIEQNSLYFAREEYNKNNFKGFESKYKNVLGFKLTLVGENISELERKKKYIDKMTIKHKNTPCMKETAYIHLDINKYFINSATRNSEYRKFHEDHIDRLLNNKLNKMKKSNNNKKDKGFTEEKDFYNFLEP